MKLNRVAPKLDGTFVKPLPGFGDGGYGVAIQNAYDYAGITTNYGQGNDIPELDLEIKTWDQTKNGHISVASSTKEKIIKCKGQDFLNKFQKWNLHMHEGGVLKTVKKINFDSIHKEISNELTQLAEQLANGVHTPKTSHFILEHTKRKSYKLRIISNKAHKLFGMADSANQFNNMFTELQ